MCQERLSQNTSYTKDNNVKGKFKELSGLIKCGKCERAVKVKGKYNSLQCVGRSELKGVCDASFRGIRIEYLQEEVGKEIQKYLNNFVKNQEKWKKKKEAYQKEIEKIEIQINNLVLNLAESKN